MYTHIEVLAKTSNRPYQIMSETLESRQQLLGAILAQWIWADNLRSLGWIPLHPRSGGWPTGQLQWLCSQLNVKTMSQVDTIIA